MFHGKWYRRCLASIAMATAIVWMSGCGQSNADSRATGDSRQPASAAGGQVLQGDVRVDGSSTVYPITEAVAEEFRYVQAKVRVTVGISGTGGGFKKFCTGETDINDASRPIKPTEVELAEQHDIHYIELPVAYDGLSVLVNPKNDAEGRRDAMSRQRRAES